MEKLPMTAFLLHLPHKLRRGFPIVETSLQHSARSSGDIAETSTIRVLARKVVDEHLLSVFQLLQRSCYGFHTEQR